MLFSRVSATFVTFVTFTRRSVGTSGQSYTFIMGYSGQNALSGRPESPISPLSSLLRIDPILRQEYHPVQDPSKPGPRAASRTTLSHFLTPSGPGMTTFGPILTQDLRGIWQKPVLSRTSRRVRITRIPSFPRVFQGVNNPDSSSPAG